MPAKKASSASKSLIWIGALFGALSALTLIALLSLGERLFGFPFVPFDIFDWMARTLPGWLIGTVISTMVAIIRFFQTFLPIGDISTTAKLAEQAIAITQLILGGAVFGAILGWLAGRPGRNIAPIGLAGGLILLAITLLVEFSLAAGHTMPIAFIWLAVLFTAWGWGLARLIQRYIQVQAEPTATQLTRRQFITLQTTPRPMAIG